MNSIIGSFRIGEDISVALDATAGDPATVTAIIAKMKPAKATSNRIVLDDAATAITLSVAANGTAGWIVSLPSATSATLPAGLYGIDAKLTVGGSVELTEQTAFIALTQAALT
jgi:hypothetical protein